MVHLFTTTHFARSSLRDVVGKVRVLLIVSDRKPFFDMPILAGLRVDLFSGYYPNSILSQIVRYIILPGLPLSTNARA